MQPDLRWGVVDGGDEGDGDLPVVAELGRLVGLVVRRRVAQESLLKNQNLIYSKCLNLTHYKIIFIHNKSSLNVYNI